MSDRSSNYELDDEMLSAYLDGELSADERAAIEARLATDPAAQQLLHELRSVSQSVQALPTESLGRDLSEEIVRRAREAAPPPGRVPSAKSVAPSASSRTGDALPKIRIFSSKRAWIWASMALAAGLLIMIVQSGDESAKKLPPVAARNREHTEIQPADKSGQPARREIAISAAPESPSPPPATVAFDGEVHEKVDALGTAMPTDPTSGEPGGGQLSSKTRDSAAAGPPLAAASPTPKLLKERDKTVLKAGDASSTSAASPAQMATDKLTPASQPTGRVGGTGGASGLADEKQKSESIASSIPQRFVVVRVVAKPDTLKNGSFDRLLADNKIEFVPQPAKNQPRSIGGGVLAKPAQNESAFKEQSNKAAKGHAVDMVLVEAPAPAIESCLADLNKNSDDFLSIDVNEEPESRDRFDAKPTPTKKLAETTKSLSRFSRGNVPVAQKDTVDPRYYFYSYDFDMPNDPGAIGSPRAGSFGAEAGTVSGVERATNGDKALGDKSQPTPDIRRARRIETWGIENRQAGEPAAATGRAPRIQPGAQATNQPMSQRKPEEQAEAKADNQNNNWKVLFVFTPQESPAPSAPPVNPPK